MDGAGTIIAVVFIALALVGGAIVASYASSETVLDRGGSDEITTNGIGTATPLPNSTDAYSWSDSVEVENTTSNRLLVAETDYNWNKNNGSVTPLSQDAANTTLNVEYEYGSPSESQQEATNLLSMILDTGAWIPFLLVLALIILSLSIFGGLS